MNKVILLGRLTKDPEERRSGDMTVTRFTIAVDRRTKDGQTADFPSCVSFGKTAEFIAKYFHKGMKIALDGHLQTGSYTNKDNQKVYTTDVVVENAEFAESKKSEAETQTNKAADEWAKMPDNGQIELPFA